MAVPNGQRERTYIHKRKRVKPVPLTALAPHYLYGSEPVVVPFAYRRAYAACAEAISANLIDGRMDVSK